MTTADGPGTREWERRAKGFGGPKRRIRASKDRVNPDRESRKPRPGRPPHARGSPHLLFVGRPPYSEEKSRQRAESRVMPHRAICVAILIFWAFAAVSLFTRDLLPDLVVGPPPDMRTVTRAGDVPRPTKWSILVDDAPVEEN